jgi:hypothetical protein
MSEILNRLVGFFARFDPKDWITLTASLLAILLSILSFRQRTGEGRLALRKQLTDLLEKLTELNTEIAKFRHLRSKKDEYPPNYDRLLNDQRRFLVRQAAFVASQIKDMISPYEYLVMAGAFDGVDDAFQAERYYQLATSNADDPLDRGIAVRGYARYLFIHGRTEEGRTQFIKAVECFNGESDLLHHYRADTYERWANQERDWSSEVEVNRLLEQASTEYGKLNNPTRRKYETERVLGLLPQPRDNEEPPPNNSLNRSAG